jgi:hypothetical protein
MIRALGFALRSDVIGRSSGVGLTTNLIIAPELLAPSAP